VGRCYALAAGITGVSPSAVGGGLATDEAHPGGTAPKGRAIGYGAADALEADVGLTILSGGA